MPLLSNNLDENAFAPASIELSWPLPAFELLVDGAVESIEFCNDDTGARFTLDGSALPAADGASDAAAMTVFFDEGILEAFRDGEAGTWTQLSLATVTSVRVTPGEHRLRVRVHASDDSYDQTNTIAGSLPPDGERQVLIQCEKHKPLRLSMQ